MYKFKIFDLNLHACILDPTTNFFSNILSQKLYYLIDIKGNWLVDLVGKRENADERMS